jgi:UDP-2,3-diacylglucosamine pyrophosphatase LpxH
LAKLLTYAKKCFEEKLYQLMITGHTHVFDDKTTENFRSINLGSWYDHPKYLFIEGNQVSIHNLSESNCSA